MNRLVSIGLIIAGLALGFMGFNKLDNSQASLEIGGLEISAGDQKSTNTAYVMMGLGAILLVGGIVGATKK